MIVVLELDERDMILRAKQNDNDAINYIFNKYKPLVNHMASKYYMSNGGDRDDIIQIANIALWDAIKDYNGENNFASFAKTVVNNAMLYNLKKNTTQKAKSINQSSSLDNTVNDGDTSLYDLVASKDMSPEDITMSNINISKLSNFIENELSDKESKAIKLTVNGYSTQEIADLLGVTYKSINNALARARAKIKMFANSSLESREKVEELLKFILG